MRSMRVCCSARRMAYLRKLAQQPQPSWPGEAYLRNGSESFSLASCQTQQDSRRHQPLKAQKTSTMEGATKHRTSNSTLHLLQAYSLETHKVRSAELLPLSLLGLRGVTAASIERCLLLLPCIENCMKLLRPAAPITRCSFRDAPEEEQKRRLLLMQLQLHNSCIHKHSAFWQFHMLEGRLGPRLKYTGLDFPSRLQQGIVSTHAEVHPRWKRGRGHRGL